MKILLAASACLFCLSTASLSAAIAPWGTLLFNNSTPSKVTNSLTGQAVPAGNTFRVALYAAAAGEMNEANFTKVADTNFFSAGLFIGGTVLVPPIPPGGTGHVQVRVWEMAYGSTYEAASQAGMINGRGALLGKSPILGTLTGDGETLPPRSLIWTGLKSIILTAATGPAFSVNSILVPEGTNGTVQAVFTVQLNPPTASATSVDFVTLDGSAVAGSDYVATNGTLNFAAGQTSGVVSVTVTADAPVEADEDFFLRLTNSVGAATAPVLGRCLITEVRLVGLSVDVAITFNTVAGHHYVVEKSDDFVNWSAVTGAGNVTGTGSTATVYDVGGGCQASRIYRARLLD
jgi:hypothetical protein